jgi:hypothetical protein
MTNDGAVRPTGEVEVRKLDPAERRAAAREARTMAPGATWLTLRYNGDDLAVTIAGSRAYAAGRTATATLDVSDSGTKALKEALDSLIAKHQDEIEEATFDAAVDNRAVARARGEL